MEADSRLSDDVLVSGITLASTGDTLAHLAARLDRVDILEILEHHGANFSVSADDGLTPLLAAAIRGSNAATLWLAKRPIDHNTRDEFGNGVLHYTRSPVVINEFANLGLNIDRPANKTGRTPLHNAAYNGRLEVALRLVELGAFVRARDANGAMPLHLAVVLRWDISELTHMVEALVDGGASVHDTDTNGNTPLHYALGAEREHDWLAKINVEAADLLRRLGADQTKLNRHGHSPIATAWNFARNERERSELLRTGFVLSLRDRMRKMFSPPVPAQV